jgi:hypothetical protein
MRRLIAAICVVLLSGCAATRTPPAGTGLTQRVYAPAPAMALAFDPKVGGSNPAGLWRDQRGLAAFGGFDESSTEYYDVQTDDNVVSDTYPSTYQREVISDRVGTLYH